MSGKRWPVGREMEVWVLGEPGCPTVVIGQDNLEVAVPYTLAQALATAVLEAGEVAARLDTSRHVWEGQS